MTPNSQDRAVSSQPSKAVSAIERATLLAREISAGSAKADSSGDYSALSAKLREIERLFEHGLFLPRGDLAEASLRKYQFHSHPNLNRQIERFGFSRDSGRIAIANRCTSLTVRSLADDSAKPALVELGSSADMCTRAEFIDERRLLMVCEGANAARLALLDCEGRTIFGNPKISNFFRAPKAICDLSLSRGSLLAISGSDCVVRIIERKGDRGVQVAEAGLQEYPDRIAMSPDGKGVLVSEAIFQNEPASRVSLFLLERPENQPAELCWQGQIEWPGRVTALSYSPDGKRAAIAGDGGDLLIYETEGVDFLDKPPAHPLALGSRINAIDFNLTGSLLAVGCADRITRVYSLSSTADGGVPELAASFSAAGAVTALGFSRDGASLAVGDDTGKVQVFAGQRQPGSASPADSQG